MSEASARLVFVVFLVSFLVGSISGGVFGVLSASLLADRVMMMGERGPVRLGGSAPLRGQDQSTVAVIRAAEPAVVSIVVTKDVPKFQQPSFGFDPFSDDFFENFFRQRQPSGETERREVGGGTGFIVSADGLIVTNRHVVEDESADYSILRNDGSRLDATVLARDQVTDLAVLKVDASDLPTLPFGDSDALALGEPVIAIGNALGEFRNTVSTGVVSGLARSVTAGGSQSGPEQLTGVIQTDAAINPGNSGGPLLNLSGEVIGINTAVAQGAENIGFAIPANEVKRVVASVKETGRIVRPFLGVRYLIVTPEIAKQQSLPVDYGALVVRGNTAADLAVTPGSPADKAGIVENDILLEIQGKKITTEMPLQKLVSSFAVGDTIAVAILHKGDQKTVTLTLAERK